MTHKKPQQGITYHIDDIKEIKSCGSTVIYYFELRGYVLPFKTEPTKGDHDYKSCDNCQKYRIELLKHLMERYQGNGAKKGFPFCCKYHSNLIREKQFKMYHFDAVPEMVADKIIYTNQHIINNSKREDYYEDITDYIYYTIDSFGQMPKECGIPLFLDSYLFQVCDLLKKNNAIAQDRKKKLLEFLWYLQTPDAKKIETDLNILVATYEKWFKIFPFEISFFKSIKQHYKRTLPIINKTPEMNRYSGTTHYKFHTKSSLIEVLMKLTNDIITQVNTAVLYEQGLLSEPQKTKAELILHARKMKLDQGYVNCSQNEEKQYRAILKEWFDDEKLFIDEITPVLKPNTINNYTIERQINLGDKSNYNE